MSIIEDDDNFEVELEEVEDDIDDDDATWMQYKNCSTKSTRSRNNQKMVKQYL